MGRTEDLPDPEGDDGELDSCKEQADRVKRLMVAFRDHDRGNDERQEEDRGQGNYGHSTAADERDVGDRSRAEGQLYRGDRENGGIGLTANEGAHRDGLQRIESHGRGEDDGRRVRPRTITTRSVAGRTAPPDGSDCPSTGRPRPRQRRLDGLARQASDGGRVDTPAAGRR